MLNEWQTRVRFVQNLSSNTTKEILELLLSLPSHLKDILTIVDQFSRFTFAFTCPDVAPEYVNNCLCQPFAILGVCSYIHSDRWTSFLSADLRLFMHSRGIVTCRTTSQVERHSEIIWKAVSIALKFRRLPVIQWEIVIAEALHSIRSFLSIATNETTHERLLKYQRRSSSGVFIPTWLSVPGPILLKWHARQCKYEPLVDEVGLIEATPSTLTFATPMAVKRYCPSVTWHRM